MPFSCLKASKANYNKIDTFRAGGGGTQSKIPISSVFPLCVPSQIYSGELWDALDQFCV